MQIIYFMVITMDIRIRTALISVYSKDRMDEIARLLQKLEIKIISTGGTYDYIKNLGIDVVPVESITGYPSVLGGRVKTLHPKIFGGILCRREHEQDISDSGKFDFPLVDLVIVDLYPFEETLASGANEDEIIEKIDIGGITLIRAAAKNFMDVLVVPSSCHYDNLISLLLEKHGTTSLTDRKDFATQAFNVSSHYDTAIFNYFNKDQGLGVFKQSILRSTPLRYGENPHQKGVYFGNIHDLFDQLHGKEISFNNLVDIDAAFELIQEFQEPTFVIIKHTNACGVASRKDIRSAWFDALACDPVSAFGGVIISNRPVTENLAGEINKLFFEILIAEEFDPAALDLLKSKKNRIILKKKNNLQPGIRFKSILNGVIAQEKDLKTETETDFSPVTKKKPTSGEISDLIFANKIVKHQKSNTIVLVKNHQLVGCGTGQTSRVDALKQAIQKAKDFGFPLEGAVMASDAFFPFPDCVEIAFNAGITSVVQPGGSVRDAESVAFCDAHGQSMVFTGTRHFKH